MTPALCDLAPAKWLIISSNVPPLIYYSYGIAIISSLVIGLVVFFRGRHKLANQALLFMLLSFVIWVVASLIFWATNRSDTIMFTWATTLLVEPMVYAGALYTVRVLIDKRDLQLNSKLLIFGLFIPIFALLPTTLSLKGFDLSSCLALEGPIATYYIYAVEIFLTLWMVLFSIRRYISAKEKRARQEIVFLSTGFLLLLIAFASGNIIGSITENWNLAQIGLFGMPIFIGILSYTIVRFKTFNIKLIATQALVIALLIMIGAQFLFVKVLLNVILNGVAFIATIVFGNLLIRSVKREIRQKEKLQQLSEELEKANLTLAGANEKLKGLDKLKTEFLSLASHQLRSPLTAIKGYASMLDEGAYGKLSDEQDTSVKRIYASAQGLSNLVEDLLNISKIEQGGMKYEMSPTELAKPVADLAADMKIPAENKKLELRVSIPPGDTFKTIADPVKIRQVFLNLVDNSIKYTPTGYVEIGLKRDSKNDIVFYVKDTGVGVTAETKAKLFQKFSRGEGGKLNTGGSGLGLYLAQEIAKAHKGEITIDSEGLGKGTTFSVTLPAAK